MKKEVTIKKFASLLTALAMTVALLPSYTVFADTAECGLAIKATDGTTPLVEGTDYSFSENKLTISTQTPVTVEMADGVTTTADTITADTSGGDVNILLKNVNIATTQRNAVEIKGGNTAVFDIKGTNTISTTDNSCFEANQTGLTFKSASEGILNLTGSSFAISTRSSSGAAKPLNFEGNVRIKISGCTSHGIFYQTGPLSFNGSPVAEIDAVKGKYAIYAKGMTFNSGSITINYAEDGGSSYSIACSEDSNDIKICGTADIHIKNARRGINSNGGKVIITDNAKLRMYDGEGEARHGGLTMGEAITTGSSHNELQISGNALVDVLTSGTGGGINPGKTTIENNARVELTIDSEGYKNGLRLYGNLDVRNSGELKITVKAGSKITGIYGNSSTAISLFDSARVTLAGTYEGAYVGPISLSGNASMVIKDALKKAASNGTLSIADSATFEASLITTSAPASSDRLIGSYTVKPADGKAYMVKAGSTLETAETKYYASETTKSSTRSWRYFYAEPTTSIPVTITAENKETTYGIGTYDVAQLFDIDENAGAATYSVVDETGAGVADAALSGSILTVTKTGEIRIKAETAANGLYLPANATAVLTVLPKTISPIISLEAPVKSAAPQRSIETAEYTATVEWSPEVPTDGVFAKRTQYTATITITPKTNYTTAGIGENGYTIDGATAIENAADSGAVRAVFPTTAGGGSGSNTSNVASYAVRFETNGGSKLANQVVSHNTPANEPKAPTKEGFEFAGWYADKELKTKYDFSTKVTKAITLYAAWTKLEKDPDPTEPTDKPTEPTNPTTPSTDVSFDDVSKGDWYYDDVTSAVKKGLFKGITDKLFAPNNNITRGMFVTTLYRAEGEPDVKESVLFHDASADSYYSKAVAWAHLNDIVLGISENEFAPEASITREQIAAIMFRYAKHKGYDVSVGENTNILSYTDAEDISEYATEAMQYAVGSGLIKGKTETTLNPKEPATRAEIAAILQRFIEKNK